MTRNLFLDDLKKVTSADVEAFLGIGGPPETGLPEGVRLDYKAKPKDIGDHATALANTYGGLVILGVEEENGRPVAAPGIEHPKGSDPKTQIVSSVLANVYPVVRVEVEAVAVVPEPPDGPRSILLVRVPEGDFPPYMYTREGANRVRVRHGDKNANASPLELEAMFQRRRSGGLTIGPFAFIDPTPPFYARAQVGSNDKADAFVRLQFRPETSLGIAWHRATEGRLRSVIDEYHMGESISIFDAGPNAYEFALSVFGLEQRWRATSDGTIYFSACIANTDNRIYLPDLANDLVGALICARVMWERFGYFGRLMLASELQTQGKPLENHRTRHRAPTELEGVGGHVGSTAPNSQHATIIDHAQLAEVGGVLAGELNYHLRAQRRGSSDLAALIAALKRIAKSAPI